MDARTRVSILRELMPMEDSTPAVLKTRDLLGPTLVPGLYWIMSTDDMLSHTSTVELLIFGLARG